MDYQFQQFLGLLSDPESVKRMQDEARLRANDYERMAYQKYGEDRGSVQLNGNMVAIPDGFAGGGRISGAVPLSPEQRLILGLTGGGYRSRYGSDLKAQGLDAMIQGNDQSFGVQYNRPQPNNPAIPRWMLNYSRSF